jgi:PIN domain nuclease of toxin-antitoxin system
MPVLETDFLKGVIDPKDKLHSRAMKAVTRVKAGEWSVASSSFLELDIIMKNNRVSDAERFDIFSSLSAEIPSEMIASVTPNSLANSGTFTRKLRRDQEFLFRFNSCCHGHSHGRDHRKQ